MSKKNNKYAILSVISLLAYIFSIMIFIEDKTAPLSKVIPVYILIVALLITTYLFVKDIEDKKRKLVSVVIFIIQFGLGVFLTVVWFAPRSDYVLSNQMWLNSLKIFSSLHYVSGFTILFRSFFK